MRRPIHVFPIIALLLGLATAMPAGAATLTVTDYSDDGATTTTAGTLRWAVAMANAAPDTDTIVFATGNSITVLDKLTVTAPVLIDGGGTQVVGSPDPDIVVLAAGSDGSVIRDIALVDGGMGIFVWNSAGHQILGCRIGTDWNDAFGRGNNYGIYLNGGTGVRIGGTGAGEGNVISGSTVDGIQLYQSTGTIIQNNYIGTTSDGNTVMANGGSGIMLLGRSVANLIGGSTAAGQGNLISGNYSYGVRIYDYDCQGNTLCGNVIGLSQDQSQTLPNGAGVLVRAQGNWIGLPAAGCENVIAGHNLAGHSNYGIRLENGTDRPRGNVLQNNYVGVNLAGTAFPNSYGIQLQNADSNLIGGYRQASQHQRNIVSASVFNGISVTGHGNTICGNWVGVDPTGSTAVPNDNGIAITNGNGNLIGGPNVDADHQLGNLISGHANPYRSGVGISTGSGNTVAGNYIGVDAAGNTCLPNDIGIYLANTTVTANLIGGPDPTWGNLVSGSNQFGICLYSAAANAVLNNRIGTNAAGDGQILNLNYGVQLTGGAHHNQIGLPGLGNVICASAAAVELDGSTTNENLVVGNWLNTLATTTAPVVAAPVGILVQSGAHDNHLGLQGTGFGNLIAYTTSAGIRVDGASTTHNGMYGNTICAFSGSGIVLANGGNESKAQPAVTYAYDGTVSGFAQTFDAIEIFQASRAVGWTGGSLRSVAFALADASGNWSTSYTGLGAGDTVCCLSTDSSRNTSAFSVNIAIALPPSPTVTSTVTTTSTVTPTPTMTPTVTFTLTPTVTPTITLTATLSATATASPTGTATLTATASSTLTPSATITLTSTITPTATISPTATVSPTLTPGIAVTRVLACPNPAREHVRFVWPAQALSRATVYVYNASGERVAALAAVQPGGEGLVWDVRALAPGLYFYRVTLTRAGGGQETVSGKLALVP